MSTTLKSYPQWVAWKYVQDPKRKKPLKLPINPHTGKAADTTDPTTWGTYDEARSRCERYHLAGVGFVLTAADPFVGADLDGCRNGDKIAAWALDVIRRLNSYTEISPSGNGIRIFVVGKLPPVGRKKGQIEVYETGRFLTLTLNHLPGTPMTIEERQEELTEWHTAVWGLNQEFSLSLQGLGGKHANTTAGVLACNSPFDSVKPRINEFYRLGRLDYAVWMRDRDVQKVIVDHLERDCALVDQVYLHPNGVSVRFACPFHDESRPDRPSADLARSLSDPELVKIRCHHRGDGGMRSRGIGLVDWFAWNQTGQYRNLSRAELKLWTVRSLIDVGLLDAPEVERRPLPDDLPEGAPAGLRQVWHGIVERARVQLVIGGSMPLTHKFLAGWSGVTEHAASTCVQWLLKRCYLSGGLFLRPDGSVSETRESDRSPEVFKMNLEGKPPKPRSKTLVNRSKAEWKRYYMEAYDYDARDELLMGELAIALTDLKGETSGHWIEEVEDGEYEDVAGR